MRDPERNLGCPKCKQWLRRTPPENKNLWILILLLLIIFLSNYVVYKNILDRKEVIIASLFALVFISIYNYFKYGSIFGVKNPKNKKANKYEVVNSSDQV